MMGPLMLTTGAGIALGAVIGAASGGPGGAIDLFVAPLFALGPSAMTILFAWEISWRLTKPRQGALSWEDARRLTQRAWLPVWILSIAAGAVLHATGPT
jgi:hypothetical protein